MECRPRAQGVSEEGPGGRTGYHVAVGALNPSDYSVALFSNIGDWVTVYAPGVALLSTVPDVFDGGVQAGTRDDSYGHRRETLDVDDFRGGFGVWSGTSFAAPSSQGSSRRGSPTATTRMGRARRCAGSCATRTTRACPEQPPTLAN